TRRDGDDGELAALLEDDRAVVEERGVDGPRRYRCEPPAGGRVDYELGARLEDEDAAPVRVDKLAVRGRREDRPYRAPDEPPDRQGCRSTDTRRDGRRSPSPASRRRPSGTSASRSAGRGSRRGRRRPRSTGSSRVFRSSWVRRPRATRLTRRRGPPRQPRGRV